MYEYDLISSFFYLLTTNHLCVFLLKRKSDHESILIHKDMRGLNSTVFIGLQQSHKSQNKVHQTHKNYGRKERHILICFYFIFLKIHNAFTVSLDKKKSNVSYLIFFKNNVSLIK